MRVELSWRRPIKGERRPPTRESVAPAEVACDRGAANLCDEAEGNPAQLHLCTGGRWPLVVVELVVIRVEQHRQNPQC